MKNYNTFPFLGIVGQEKVKKALILNIINPNIGGVLLCGEKGCAKSTIVRALGEILDDVKLVNLPLNISEDRLVGSLDINKAINNGEKSLEYGLLKEADGNILYVDEINLLSEHITNILLEVSSTGENIIEREGLSFAHPSKFILIGSMNPEEGSLRPQFVDRFGMYVEVHGENDIEKRVEVIKRRLEYENNPEKYIDKFKDDNEILKEKIRKAQQLKNKVKISDENLIFASKLSKTGCTSGHRAEIALIETAIAISALNGEIEISENTIKESAEYVLPHRIREAIDFNEEEEFTDTSDSNTENSENFQEEVEDNSTYDAPPIDFIEDKNNSNTNKDSVINNESDNWQDISPLQDGFQLNITNLEKRKIAGFGKRTKVRTNSKKGRYIKYRIPVGKVNDIAVDATIRTAAMNGRKKKGEVLEIKNQDIREKVREKRTGITILFLVDASGSMGARKRMGAVKGAILSLLEDAYEKRDSIGLVAFRKDRADVLLNITRSIDLAQKCLKDLKTGGKTPLADGLEKAYEILKVEKVRKIDVIQYLVIVSDGKANVPLKNGDPFVEATEVGKKIYEEGINTIILDTENNYIQYGLAKKLSEVMHGDYIKISNISKNLVEESVKGCIHRKF